jgi:hypothetical protein
LFAPIKRHGSSRQRWEVNGSSQWLCIAAARKAHSGKGSVRVTKFMHRSVLLGAVALAAAMVSAPAFADDPNDRMTPEELARDRATIRRLNREQLEYVRKRDAGYAEGWRAYDRARGAQGSSDRRYQEQVRGYEADRRRYEQAMDDWRDAVAACRAGYYEYCRR